MEAIKAEVNAKIRSAIKAKLMELGVYVDEELPDYIMVMVVNKRTKVQMDDDLQLFLGSNTEIFTNWLHQVLQKLEEVTVANLEKKSVKRIVAPDTENIASKRKTSSTSSDNEVHRKEKRRKSSTSEDKKNKKSGNDNDKDTKKDSDVVNKISTKEGDKIIKSHVSESTSGLSKQNKDAVVSSTVDTKSVPKSSPKTSGFVGVKSPTKKLLEISDISRKVGSANKLDDLQKVGTLSDRTFMPIQQKSKEQAKNKVDTSSDKQSTVQVQKLQSGEISKNASSDLIAVAQSQPQGKVKVALLHSDDEDDEDFINIKADAEAEELLNEELPKESLEPIVIAPVSAPEQVVQLEEPLVPSEHRKVLTTITPPESEQVEVPSNSVKEKTIHKRISNPDRCSEKPLLSSIPLSERFARKRKLDREPEIEDKHPVMSVASRKTPPVLSVKDRLGIKKLTSSERNRSVESRVVDHSDRSRNHSLRLADRLGQRVNSPEASRKHKVHKTDAQIVEPERRNAAIQVGLSTAEKARDRPSRRLADEASTVEENDQSQKKRPLLSRVVLLRPDREEEYDPANPAVGSVASIVRVKPRPKVPAALQANKNLLLKAMAEAQKSVASAPVRPEPATPPRNNSPLTRMHSDSVFVRRPREANIAITLPNRRIQSYRNTQTRESNVDRVVVPVKLESTSSHQQKLLIQVSSNETSQLENDVKENSTMNDRLDSPSLKINVKEEEGHEQTGERHLEEDEEEMLPDEGIVTEEPDNEDELPPLYPPVGLASRMPRERPAPQRAESPQFLVTLDGLDPNMFQSHDEAAEDQSPSKMEEEEEEEEAEKDADIERRNADTPPPKEKGKSVSPIVFTKRDSPSEIDSNLPKSLDRCKYWPACRLATKCTYHHPTVPCKSFPKCQFREKCLYVHPMCKFDSSCTRRDCPFTHAASHNIIAPVAAGKLRLRAPSRPSPLSTQVCKFFPKCSNAGCRFLHPKPCRYGKYCNKQDCSFLHDELPSADKLKWTSPFRV